MTSAWQHPAPAAKNARALWRDGSFALYWAGRAVSLLGTAITGVALPILVFRLTGSALLTALLAALEVLPYLLFGLFAGELADRVNRRALLVGCDLVNALALGSVPLAALLHALSAAQVLAVALVSASAFVWFDAADFGALLALAGRERLAAATSAVAAASTVGGIVGPALGGALIATLGAAPALSLDAASYLVSAASLLLIPRALSAARGSGEERPSAVPGQRTLSGVREGLRFLWGHRLVRVLTGLSFGVSFTGGAVSGLLVVYAVRALGLPTDDARIGLLFAAGAAAALLATVLLPRLTRWLPVGWITLAGLFANLALLVLLAGAGSWRLALVLYGGWEASYALITTNGRLLRQLAVPDALQSRVNTYARMIAWGGTPFGAAAGGVLAQALSIRLTYLIVAAGVALSAAAGWRSPLRERTRMGDLTIEAERVRQGGPEGQGQGQG